GSDCKRTGPCKRPGLTGIINETEEWSWTVNVFDSRSSRRHLGRHVEQSHDICSQSEMPGCSERTLWRFFEAVQLIGTNLDCEPGEARRTQTLSRPERHVSLYGECLPVWTVQKHRRQGTGLRTRLAHRRTDAIHHECCRSARRNCTRRFVSV